MVVGKQGISANSMELVRQLLGLDLIICSPSLQSPIKTTNKRKHLVLASCLILILCWTFHAFGRMTHKERQENRSGQIKHLAVGVDIFMPMMMSNGTDFQSVLGFVL